MGRRGVQRSVGSLPGRKHRGAGEQKEGGTGKVSADLRNEPCSYEDYIERFGSGPKTIHTKFYPGDRVCLGDIRGHISCISVSWPFKCKYEVTYWDCGQRREVWVDEFEVEVDQKSKSEIIKQRRAMHFRSLSATESVGEIALSPERRARVDEIVEEVCADLNS